VLLNPPEPAKAGVAAIATSPIANKLTDRSERILPNLPLTDSKEMIASWTAVIVEVGNKDAVDLFIVFITVESQPVRSRDRTGKVTPLLLFLTVGLVVNPLWLRYPLVSNLRVADAAAGAL